MAYDNYYEGTEVVDSNGETIGKLKDLYLENDEGTNGFGAVQSGLLHKKIHFFPLQEGKIEEDRIVLPYDKEKVLNSPTIDSDEDISEATQNDLYKYYWADQDQATDTDMPVEGHDTSGPTTDTAMTRSEEELHVNKQTVEAGRARLKKYIRTEHVTTTVPVQREEVRLEREPITDGNIDEALNGPDLSDEEHEVILTEEVPVVDKKVVPKERIRLTKDTVVDDVEVGEDLRKEQIDLDDKR